MLNNNWLKTYITLVETGHFTKTAELLAMTQPGVSQHLQKLEAYCGHKLIKRFGQAFEITEQGKLMHAYALDVFRQHQDLLEALNVDHKYQGVCKIACSGANALSLYPKLIELQLQYPELICELEVAPNAQILKRIESSDSDLGIVNNFDITAAFNVTQLDPEDIVIIAAKCWQDDNLSLPSLLKKGFINHPDGKRYLALLLQQANFDVSAVNSIRETGYVNQLHQILLPVANGLGFTVLPRSALLNSQLQDKLCELDIASVTARQERYLIHKKHRDLPARLQLISDIIVKLFGTAKR